MTLRRAVIAGLAAGALMLTGCTVQNSAPVESEELSASKAGGLYLAAVCPVNDLWDEADLELDRLRLTLGREEGDSRAVARALDAIAQASEDAAEELAPEKVNWPASAESAIEEVRETLLSDRKQALRVARLPAEEIAAYEWQGGREIAEAATSARMALRLPADASSACEQWNEQQVGRQKPTP